MIATVRSVAKRQTRQRRSMVTVTLADGTGFLDLDVLQPAVGRRSLPLGHGARGLGRRAALPRPAPDGEPGGRGPSRRGAGAGAHGEDHARASGVGRRHAQHRPRADLVRPRTAPRAARPAAAGGDRGGVARRVGRGAAADPLPGRRRRARRGEGAAEVRRALHARAGGRVPQATTGGRTERRGARPGHPARPSPPREPALRADGRAGPRDGRDRRADGPSAADEPAAPRRRRLRQDPRRAARVPPRDRLGAPGGDHGPDRGAGGPARAFGGGAARAGRRRRFGAGRVRESGPATPRSSLFTARRRGRTGAASRR